MKYTHWVLFTLSLLPLILLTCGSVFAQQVHIPLTVSVTLQPPAQPVAASQLCASGKTINPFGSAARIDCPAPAVADRKNSPRTKDDRSDTPASPPSQTQVMVTF